MAVSMFSFVYSSSCKFERLFVLILLLFICSNCLDPQGRKSNGKNLVEELKDPKDLKKVLRTKNNVMILYASTAKSASSILSLYNEVAVEVKGQATLLYVDCSGEGKKICKKLKVTPNPIALKHYKDGNFHKDYDRKETIQSMANFLKNPTGEAPWDEDDAAKDVVHINDPSTLEKLLHREKIPVLVMFYAPWCQFCQRLKPDYASAASELKTHSVLAAMDVNRAENSVVSKHFNITGFPTLLYFEKGHLKFKYEGQNNKDEIIKFMKNPEKPPAEKPKEEVWSETESDVVHLTTETFDSVLQDESSILVMFYAPWCGHCKKMKPEFEDAATKMKADQVPGILAAVDATKEKPLGEKFKVSGYPTVKYFKNGEYLFDANVRVADKIIEFMKDPKEPPPPPPPETPWNETESNVVHLDEESFKVILKRKKHALVMFYAPWCGHCKKAKPEFEAAALHYKDEPKVEFAAVDCTQFQAVCQANQVEGYPTFRYFSYYKTSKPYDGGRTGKDFNQFMTGLLDPSQVVTPKAAMPSNPEQWWEEIPAAKNVLHLNSNTFDEYLQKEESLLVMFYAPWCGHCKSMKPAYAEAAEKLAIEKIVGKLAAVDAVADRDLATKFSIRGFPTVKYFKKGKLVKEYDLKRTTEDFVNFMKMALIEKDEL